jgi:hypothetical protein
MSTSRLAGLAAVLALAFPAAASAHPGWYFITAKVAKTPEVQTLTPTGGDWKPSPNATTIHANATPAEVQAAIDADPTAIHYIASGAPATAPGYDNVRVTGNAGGPYTVTFVGAVAGINVDALNAAGANVNSTDGGADVTYSGDPALDQSRMAEQQQAVIVNDGYTFGFRETNGVGPVFDAGIQGYKGAGMLNLSKVLPGSYRGAMTELQKLAYGPAQTGIQVHATCGGVTALESPANIAQVWDRPSDHDPFYNYIPWQKDSAGLGDNPNQWIPVVQTTTGVNLSSVTDFAAACAGLGGTYHPADTKSTTASAAISDAVNSATAPLNTQVTGLNGQVNSLTAQVGSLIPQLSQLQAQNATLSATQAPARPLQLTLTGSRLAPGNITTMVTGTPGQAVRVTVKLSSAAAKALRLKSATIASAKKTIDAQGAALVSLAAKKTTIKKLKKAHGSLPATVAAAAGTATFWHTARLIG